MTILRHVRKDNLVKLPVEELRAAIKASRLNKNENKKVIFDSKFFEVIEQLNNEYGLLKPVLSQESNKWVIFNRIGDDPFLKPDIVITPSK